MWVRMGRKRTPRKYGARYRHREFLEVEYMRSNQISGVESSSGSCVSHQSRGPYGLHSQVNSAGKLLALRYNFYKEQDKKILVFWQVVWYF